MTRSTVRAVIALFLAAPYVGCTSPAATSRGSSSGDDGKVPASARPGWVDETRFVEVGAGASAVYGVGRESFDDSRCIDGQLVFERAANRARTEVARLAEKERVTRTSTSTTRERTAIATLEGAEVVRGWFDGERTVYVLVRVPAVGLIDMDVPADVARASASGGTSANAAFDAARAASRAALEKAGACSDPFRRAERACCGPVTTFCADPTRFDHRPTPDTCACGDGDPCLADYHCEVRGGAPRCICRGPKCPCDQLSCRTGQTCEDDRCY